MAVPRSAVEPPPFIVPPDHLNVVACNSPLPPRTPLTIWNAFARTITLGAISSSPLLVVRVGPGPMIWPPLIVKTPPEKSIVSAANDVVSVPAFIEPPPLNISDPPVADSELIVFVFVTIVSKRVADDPPVFFNMLLLLTELLPAPERMLPSPCTSMIAPAWILMSDVFSSCSEYELGLRLNVPLKSIVPSCTSGAEERTVATMYCGDGM